MPPIPRKTLGELQTRYALHPQLRDLYVEGDFDHRLLRWMLAERGAHHVVAYPISGIEIAAATLLEVGLPDNTRSRVIYLVFHLTSQLGCTQLSVSGVIDRDFEDVSPSKCLCNGTFITDWYCMQVYLFRGGSIRQSLKVDVGLDDSEISEIFDGVEPVLRELWLCRAANETMNWGMEWLDPWKCLNLSPGNISLDRTEFIRRYLNKNGQGAHVAAFESEVARLRMLTEHVAPCCVRGHDAFEVLAACLESRGVSPEACSETYLLGVARSGTQVGELAGYEMFARLLSRLGA